MERWFSNQLYKVAGKETDVFFQAVLVRGVEGGVRAKRRRSPFTFHFSILSRPNNYCMRFHWTLDSRTDVSISSFPGGISAIYLAFPTAVFPRQVGRFRKDNPTSNDNAKAAKGTEHDFGCSICLPVIPCIR